MRPGKEWVEWPEGPVQIVTPGRFSGTLLIPGLSIEIYWLWAPKDWWRPWARVSKQPDYLWVKRWQLLLRGGPLTSLCIASRYQENKAMQRLSAGVTTRNFGR